MKSLQDKNIHNHSTFGIWYLISPESIADVTTYAERLPTGGGTGLGIYSVIYYLGGGPCLYTKTSHDYIGMGQSLHTHDVTHSHVVQTWKDRSQENQYWEKIRNLCHGFVSCMAIISSQTNVQMNIGPFIMCYIVILNLLSGVNAQLTIWQLPSKFKPSKMTST